MVLQDTGSMLGSKCLSDVLSLFEQQLKPYEIGQVIPTDYS